MLLERAVKVVMERKWYYISPELRIVVKKNKIFFKKSITLCRLRGYKEQRETDEERKNNNRERRASMMEDKLEQELGNFDFSLCHSVRESLLDKLLTMHRKDNATQHSHKWAAARLDEDELDWVAAAGTGRILQNCEEQLKGKGD